MKLRIETQSLRLRLAPEDVAELARSGRVSEVVAFPPEGSRRLVYELKVSADATTPRVRWEGERLIASLSPSAARSLTDTNLVGIEERLAVEGGAELLLVIEKDLKPRRPARGALPTR